MRRGIAYPQMASPRPPRRPPSMRSPESRKNAQRMMSTNACATSPPFMTTASRGEATAIGTNSRSDRLIASDSAKPSTLDLHTGKTFDPAVSLMRSPLAACGSPTFLQLLSPNSDTSDNDTGHAPPQVRAKQSFISMKESDVAINRSIEAGDSGGDPTGPGIPCKTANDTVYECDYDRNPTKLYLAIQNKQWDQVVHRASYYQHEVYTWVSRKESDQRTLRWRMLPLHAAVVFQCPSHVIDALLAIYEGGARQRDDQGKLPLHLTFRHAHNCDVEILELLLQAYPDSVNEEDENGHTPIMLAKKLCHNLDRRDEYMKLIESFGANRTPISVQSSRQSNVLPTRDSGTDSAPKNPAPSSLRMDNKLRRREISLIRPADEGTDFTSEEGTEVECTNSDGAMVLEIRSPAMETAKYNNDIEKRNSRSALLQKFRSQKERTAGVTRPSLPQNAPLNVRSDRDQHFRSINDTNCEVKRDGLMGTMIVDMAPPSLQAHMRQRLEKKRSMDTNTVASFQKNVQNGPDCPSLRSAASGSDGTISIASSVCNSSADGKSMQRKCSKSLKECFSLQGSDTERSKFPDESPSLDVTPKKSNIHSDDDSKTDPSSDSYRFNYVREMNHKRECELNRRVHTHKLRGSEKSWRRSHEPELYETTLMTAPTEAMTDIPSHSEEDNQCETYTSFSFREFEGESVASTQAAAIIRSDANIELVLASETLGGTEHEPLREKNEYGLGLGSPKLLTRLEAMKRSAVESGENADIYREDDLATPNLMKKAECFFANEKEDDEQSISRVPSIISSACSASECFQSRFDQIMAKYERMATTDLTYSEVKGSDESSDYAEDEGQSSRAGSYVWNRSQTFSMESSQRSRPVSSIGRRAPSDLENGSHSRLKRRDGRDSLIFRHNIQIPREQRSRPEPPTQQISDFNDTGDYFMKISHRGSQESDVSSMSKTTVTIGSTSISTEDSAAVEEYVQRVVHGILAKEVTSAGAMKRKLEESLRSQVKLKSRVKKLLKSNDEKSLLLRKSMKTAKDQFGREMEIHLTRKSSELKEAYEEAMAEAEKSKLRALDVARRDMESEMLLLRSQLVAAKGSGISIDQQLQKALELVESNQRALKQAAETDARAAIDMKKDIERAFVESVTEFERWSEKQLQELEARWKSLRSQMTE